MDLQTEWLQLSKMQSSIKVIIYGPKFFTALTLHYVASQDVHDPASFSESPTIESGPSGQGEVEDKKELMCETKLGERQIQSQPGEETENIHGTQRTGRPLTGAPAGLDCVKSDASTGQEPETTITQTFILP